MKIITIFVVTLLLNSFLFCQDPAIHVTAEGNVAIGNWSAASKLHVWGGGINSDFFGFYGGPTSTLPDNATFIASPSNGNMELYIGGQPRVTIDYAGVRIGSNEIGQVNYPFHVVGNQSANPMIKIESESTGSHIEYKTNDVPDGISGLWDVGMNGTYPGKFWFRGSGYGATVFFDWEGYNGFGVAEPEAVLHITQRTWDAKDGFRITNASSVLNIYGGPGGDFNIDANTWLLINRDGQYVRVGSEIMPLYPLHMASGAHVTVGGVWTDASSRSLKENIRDLSADEAFDALSKLNPQKYNYKTDKEEEYLGFIAEDVPELVATKDRKSLSPMDIVALLTKVVQQQQQKIEILEARLKISN